jgi:hypothetical protein
MKHRAFWSVAQIGILVVAVCISTLAERPGEHSKEVHFRGTISDYTPQSGGGPWEVRGQWSLTIKRDGRADFLRL